MKLERGTEMEWMKTETDAETKREKLMERDDRL